MVHEQLPRNYVFPRTNMNSEEHDAEALGRQLVLLSVTLALLVAAASFGRNDEKQNQISLDEGSHSFVFPIFGVWPSPPEMSISN